MDSVQVATPADDFKFTQEIKVLKTKFSINQLKASTLTFNIYRLVSNSQEKVLFAVYKVDLLTLAIGPVHHSIDLMNVKNGRHSGKMVCNILFT